MKIKILLTIIVLFLSCTEDQVSPSLLPSSVEKTIHRFNYCLNNISNPDIFRTLEQILVGKAKEDYDELEKLISYSINKGASSKGSASQGKSIRKKLERYIKLAKSIRIKVAQIQYEKEKAQVIAFFYDSDLVVEEKKKIILIKEDDLWKIEKILPLP